jgi:hypothetical protein
MRIHRESLQFRCFLHDLLQAIDVRVFYMLTFNEFKDYVWFVAIQINGTPCAFLN